MRKIFTFLFAALMSVGMYATTVVTITNSDFPMSGQSFTKDGVTVSAGMIDSDEGNLMAGGSFSTTLGNFTQIEVNAMDVNISGEGWSGNSQKKTWTGNASSVSFSGEIMGMGMGTTLKFTIEESAPAEKPIVVFEANGKKKEVEIESFPHTFLCVFEDEDGELDGIIRELYGIQRGYCDPYGAAPSAAGNPAVEAGKQGDNHFITISEAFDGTATVSGTYYEYKDPEDEEFTYSLTISIKGNEPETYTLLLVADPEKGSVAVTNLLGSDIIDNGNGNYTVPANAEVTILATPLEGYEFTGWKTGNIDEMVGCYYCGTALNTEDNPMTFTMTADVAYLAEFEAAAPQPDPTVMFIAFPTENRPENIEIAGVNREFTWAMVALDNDPWYVSKEHLNTYATDTIKFRDAANNAMILCEFIPANGDQEGRWQQLYLVMGDYPMDSYKLDIVRYIDELDLSNATNFAWMENAPEPLPEGIEHIVLTEKAKKVVVDGMIYIVRDGKLFNLTGAQVR